MALNLFFPGLDFIRGECETQVRDLFVSENAFVQVDLQVVLA
jgi:hypothetical protein